MNASFETKKKEVQALVKMTDIEEYSSGGAEQYDLTRDQPTYYSSGLFSTLGYEDLKKAHQESVIPVTQEDYLQRPKFRNVEELQRSADYQNIQPLTTAQAQEVLKQKQYQSSTQDVQRAFKLARQEEAARKANEGVMSHFQRLTL
jgi:hypothetical protein